VQAVHVSELPLLSVRKTPDAHTASLSPAAVQDTETASATASHAVQVSELPVLSVRKKPDAHTASLSPAAVQDTETASATASQAVATSAAM
jgi:6-phosphogluconolactonase/glucosamine-6-phosphate isomerase/deaminase